MTSPQLKVHFNTSAPPPAYSPPPAYALHTFTEGMSFAQKERMASIAEHKLGYLVSQKRREPSLRQVLLHAGFLERVLDSIDASVPDTIDEPMIDEDYAPVEIKGSYSEPQVHASLTTIVEVDEMEIDEEEDEEEDMPPLTRTLSHRPGSPVSDDEENLSDESDDELPSPPPTYDTAPDHPLFNLFEVREKARREELSNHYHIEHDDSNMFLMNNNLAVAA
jgi:hypothetical protein